VQSIGNFIIILEVAINLAGLLSEIGSDWDRNGVRQEVGQTGRGSDRKRVRQEVGQTGSGS